MVGPLGALVHAAGTRASLCCNTKPGKLVGVHETIAKLGAAGVMESCGRVVMTVEAG